MRAASRIVLTSACVLAACGAGSAVDAGADAGVAPTDGDASAVCPDEWAIEVATRIGLSPESFMGVTRGEVAHFLSAAARTDGVAGTRNVMRSYDRCGADARNLGEAPGLYMIDDVGSLRAAAVGGNDRTEWNGISLPEVGRDELALIEFRDDLTVAKIDLVDFRLVEANAIHYAWGGRADVTVGPVGASFAPTVAFRHATDGTTWSVTAPAGARTGVPRAAAVGGGRAVVATWEASTERNPSTLLVDAFSNEARHVWRARVPTSDWYPKTAVLDDGSTLLLRYAPPPTDLFSTPEGLVLTRISPTGEVSPWATIGADNTVSGEWSMSVGRDGRAVVAIAAVNSRVKLCGERYPGSTSDTETRAYLVGVDEFGKCAFVRPFDGVRGNTRISDTYVTDDHHVIVLWGDQYTDSGPFVPDPRAHQIIERIRWETLVARWGTSSNAPDAGL